MSKDKEQWVITQKAITQRQRKRDKINIDKSNQRQDKDG